MFEALPVFATIFLVLVVGSDPLACRLFSVVPLHFQHSSVLLVDACADGLSDVVGGFLRHDRCWFVYKLRLNLYKCFQRT